MPTIRVVVVALVAWLSFANADTTIPDYENPFDTRVNVIERSIERMTVLDRIDGTLLTQHDISEQIRLNMEYPPVSSPSPWDEDLNIAVSQCQQLLLLEDEDGLLKVNQPATIGNLLPGQTIGNLIGDCRSLVRPQCFTGSYGGHIVCEELYGLLERCNGYDQQLRQPNCQVLRDHICEPKDSVPSSFLFFPVCSVMGDLASWPTFESCATSTHFQDFLTPPCSLFPEDLKSCLFSGFYSANYRSVCLPTAPNEPLADAANRCTLNRFLNDNPALSARPYEEQVARFAMERMSSDDCLTLRAELCPVETGHPWFSPAIQSSDLCQMNVGNGLVEQCEAYLEHDLAAGVVRSFGGDQVVIWYVFDGQELQQWPCQQTVQVIPYHYTNTHTIWLTGDGTSWPATRQRRANLSYTLNGLTVVYLNNVVLGQVSATLSSTTSIDYRNVLFGPNERDCRSTFHFNVTHRNMQGSITKNDTETRTHEWTNYSPTWISAAPNCATQRSPDFYLTTIDGWLP